MKSITILFAISIYLFFLVQSGVSTRTCKSSPINVLSKDFTSLPIESFKDIVARNVNLSVKKGVIVLTSKDFKKAHITGAEDSEYTTFLLDKVEIHIPSLHQIDGKPHPVEINFVYRKILNGPNKNNLAIISTLYKFAKFGGLRFWNDIAKGLSKRNRKMNKFNLKDVVRDGHIFGFNYDGTLTSPPCKNVEWHINKDIGTIGIKQFQEIKAAIKKKSMNLERKK